MIIMGKGKKRGWAWGWGIFLILIASLVLANQFGGFLELGFWSIAVAALAVAYLIKCLIDLSFASLPVPIAALYYIFQVPLELPPIAFWPLVLVTVLVTAGLHVLIPQRKFYKGKNVRFAYTGDNDADIEIDGAVKLGEDGEDRKGGKFEESGDENNPRISVQFGGGSRYLHADSLETVMLDCSFGGLEVYFDHVTLSPNGAEAFLSCKFGAIELYVPRHWRIIENMSASLGGVDVNGRREVVDENAPTLTISGNVSFGGVEVHRI
jgi:predicted membrane protein